ncbi:MAG: hypothetical protein KC800_15410 [Candidatus Eremiobacteraeota bacterium]|nr:hypothetical protein [Candidatus Eremiobacteraeota bacterium]
MPDHSISIDDVVVKDGKPQTDTVKLANKKAVFGPFGRLRDIKDDSGFKLEAKADGTFNYALGEEKHTAANVFGGAAATVNKYNQVYSELTGKTIDWSFGKDQLGVSPETGEWPNAFYARQLEGVHFFDHESTSTGNSGEVVSHEVGHAILDAIRPNYFNGMGSETGAFHEAFGDVMAFLMTLGDDQAVDKLVADTGGDLSSHRNFLSDMGEDFGNALGLPPGGIRNSFNKFTYKDPSTLPERGSETELGHEVHDFSRLWSGAFYDVLDGISDANREAGMSPKEALKAAGEEGWKLLIGQMENSPSGSDTTFKKMAAALMDGDKQFNGGQRQKLIGDIMVRRELLTPEQVGGLFKSEGPAFSGEVVNKEVTLGGDFGLLSGVKVETQVDKPMFSLFAQSDTQVSDEVEKGVKIMMQNDDILFSTDGAPDISDLFKPNGEAYKAYVSTDENGQRQLHRVPMVVCDHGHGHEGHSH